MKNIDFRKLVPVIVAIVLFVGITYTYFSPMLKGKAIVQSDIVSVKGMAKETVDFREKYNEEALWTNSMFGGMPTYQINVRYPNNLIQHVRTAITFGMQNPANILYLYLLGFFVLLLALKIDPWLSIVGAIAFAFSAYFIIIIDAGHTSKGIAIGCMPPVLAGIILTNRGKYLLGGAITALALALELLANHVQITYYFFLFIGIFMIVEWGPRIINKEVKDFGKTVATLMLAVVIALGCNITNLWNTTDYAAATMRGAPELNSADGNKTSGLSKDYATQWSMGVSETMSLMIPGFKGRASNLSVGENKKALKDVDKNYQESIAGTPQYWGDQPFTSSPYSGAIIVFLFVLGLFIVEGRMKWALLITTICAMLLSWGKNFMPLTSFFLDYFPMYNKFRTVSMVLVIAEFTIPLLAILAVDKIMKDPEIFTRKIKLAFIKYELSVKNAFFVSFALTGGLSLIYYFAPTLTELFAAGEYDRIYNQIAKSNGDSTARDFMSNLETARAALLKSDALRSFFFITLGAGIVWLFLKSKFNKLVLTGALGVLILIDMVPVDRQYLNDSSFKSKQEVQNPFPITLADKEILEDTDPNYRVLNIASNTFNESRTSYYHKSIGGYHAAKFRRYQDLIDNHIDGNIENIITTLKTQATDSALRATFARQGVLNMLNTRYIIYNQDAPPLQNRYALGNAWFVSDIKMAKDANEEIKVLGEINPANTAVVDQKYSKELDGFSPKADATAKIKLTEYKPNHLTYESETATEQLAVFSEIYYNKGWNAYIDGELKPYFGANYVLRTMRVPAGKHTVEFKFEPKPYFIGEKISLASNLILFATLGVAIFMTFRKKED
jgi:hypothetical protein